MLARLVLWGSSAAFAGIGAAFLVAPQALAALVGVRVEGATADGDVRAVYGGLQLGCAALLALASARERWLRPGLVAQLLLFGGLVLARFVSWLVVGMPAPLGLALHGAEALGLLAGALALHGLGRADPPG